MLNDKKKLFLVLVVVLSGKLFALDLSVIGGTGNFSFDSGLEAAIGGKEPFEGYVYPLGRITLTDQIAPELGYIVRAERDPLFRNLLSGEITLNAGYLKLSAGPLCNLFTAWGTPFWPGISGGIGLEFPGVVFFHVQGGATFGGGREHDCGMETRTISLGFWLPNLVNSISATSTRFGEESSRYGGKDFIYIEETLFRAGWRVEIFEKNVPYTIAVELGYQSLKRSYGGGEEDLIREVFLGFETAVTLRPQLTLIAGAETPLYVWGRLPLVRAKDRWFFRAFTGFTWSFEKA